LRRFLILVSILTVAPSAYADTPAVARLEIHPADRILHAPADSQQLSVIAHFSDGAQSDVTRLTKFTSSDSEVATVQPTGKVRFLKAGEVAILCHYRIHAQVKLAYADPKPGYVWPNPPINNLIDHLVFLNLKRLHIPPSDLCEDHLYLRRAYLDVCGMLPAPHEVHSFMNDRHPLKRQKLIDDLLDRPEYADNWAHYWNDALNINWRLETKDSAILLAWFRDHVKRNTPIDRLTRDLVMGVEIPTGRGPRSFYNDTSDSRYLADRTAEAFLGLRLSCVQCHPHFRARWMPEDRVHFLPFFVQITSKRVGVGLGSYDIYLIDRTRDMLHPVTRNPVPPRFLDGVDVKLKSGQDRRDALADWLTSPKNPYFARTMVNRIWLRLIGKGFADAPNTLHETPFIANEALLDALAKGLVAERFDMKQTIRGIMNSRTYQLSSKTNQHNQDDDRFHSHAYPRHLDGRLLLDVLAQLTEIPPVIDDMPAGTKAVHVLETQARLFFFNRPPRLSECDFESGEAGNPTTIHVLNTDVIMKTTTHPSNRIGRLLAQKRSDKEMIEDLYLASYARLPTEKEVQTITTHLGKAADRRTAWNDVLWAFMNTREFLVRQ